MGLFDPDDVVTDEQWQKCIDSQEKYTDAWRKKARALHAVIRATAIVRDGRVGRCLWCHHWWDIDDHGRECELHGAYCVARHDGSEVVVP